MTWKLKKQYKGKQIDSINIPLDDLSQKQIESLREDVRENLFYKETIKNNVKIKK